MTVCVVVPTYNEKENVARLVRQLLALDLDARVIVVDDDSPDGTGRIADQIAAEGLRVDVIHRSGKLGLGTAYLAGFAKALAEGADRIVTMDADFSHDPSNVPALVRLAAQVDVAVGSRYVAGGGVRNWGWHRRLLSWTANATARTLLGLGVRDCTAGFRCYRREVLETIGLTRVRSSGYSFLVEMLFECRRAGFTVGESPIVFANREHGQSKISRSEISKAMLTVLRLLGTRLRPRGRSTRVDPG